MDEVQKAVEIALDRLVIGLPEQLLDLARDANAAIDAYLAELDSEPMLRELQDSPAGTLPIYDALFDALTTLRDTLDRMHVSYLFHPDDSVEGRALLDRLGVGYDALRAVNPRLIYCAITGYGQDGPYTERSGHDMNYLGLNGLLGLSGDEGGPPVQAAGQIADLKKRGAKLVTVFGIGRVCHIPFWEPHFAAEFASEAEWKRQTHRLGARLHPLTVEQNALTSFRSRTTLVPAWANTIGPALFLAADRIIGGADGLFARGMQWQGLSFRMTLGHEPTPWIPSTYMPTLPGRLFYVRELAEPLTADCH